MKRALIISTILAITAVLILPQNTGAQIRAEVPNSGGWTNLRGDALRDAYSGQTFDLVYNTVGFVGVSRHSETHNADGTTDYREGDAVLAGEWTLRGTQGDEDKICYRYPELDAVRQHCFYIFREGRCYYGYNGSQFARAQDVRPELWRVRGSNRKDGPSCELGMS